MTINQNDPTARIVTSTDPDGREVIGVKLSNHTGRAWLYAEDYARFLDTFGPVAWTAHAGSKGTLYVRFSYPLDTRHGDRSGTLGTVARFISGASLKTAVVYSDGDRFNLRSSNLRIGHGRGGVRLQSAPPDNASREELAAYWRRRSAVRAARVEDAGAPALPRLSGHWPAHRRRSRRG